MQLVWTRVLETPYSSIVGSGTSADGSFWLAGAVRGPATIPVSGEGGAIQVPAAQCPFFAGLDAQGGFTRFEIDDAFASEDLIAEAVRVHVDNQGRATALVRCARVDPSTEGLRRVTSRVVIRPGAPLDFDGAPLLAMDAIPIGDCALVMLFHVEATESVGFGGQVLPPPGTIVVLRLESDGTLGWVRRLARSEDSQAVRVALCGDGRVAIVSFERDPDGAERLCVTRFAVGADPVETAVFGSPDGLRPECLIAWGLDGLIVGGSVGREAESPGNPAETKAPRGAFLMRLDGNLGVVWQRRFEGVGTSAVSALASSDDGALYFAGHFVGTLSLDVDSASSSSIATFLARVTEDGVVTAALALHDADRLVAVPHALCVSAAGCLVAGTATITDVDGRRERAYWSLVTLGPG